MPGRRWFPPRCCTASACRLVAFGKQSWLYGWDISRDRRCLKSRAALKSGEPQAGKTGNLLFTISSCFLQFFLGLLGREMLQTFLISSFFRVETLQCFRLRVCGNQFIPLDLLYAYIYIYATATYSSYPGRGSRRVGQKAVGTIPNELCPIHVSLELTFSLSPG